MRGECGLNMATRRQIAALIARKARTKKRRKMPSKTGSISPPRAGGASGSTPKTPAAIAAGAGGEDRGWLSVAECRRAMAVSHEAWNKTYRPLVPVNAIRGAGPNTRIRLRNLIDALIQRELARQREAMGQGDDDPMLYQGGESPNLERLRAAKAKLAEMDLEERRGTHADLAELHQSLLRFGGQIRRAGEILQRRYGPEATDVLNEAIETAHEDWNRSHKPAGDGIDGDGGGSGSAELDGPAADPGRDPGGDPEGGGGGQGKKAKKPPAVRRKRNHPADGAVPG